MPRHNRQQENDLYDQNCIPSAPGSITDGCRCGISPGTRQWFHGNFNFADIVSGDDYLAIDANLGKGTVNPLAFADGQDAMIEIHAAQFGGDSYVKAVEQAAKGNYKIGGTTKRNAKNLSRS